MRRWNSLHASQRMLRPTRVMRLIRVNFALATPLYETCYGWGSGRVAVSLVAFALNIPQLIYNPVRGLARAMVK